LALPLDSFAFTLDPIRITIDGQGPGQAWRFWQWQPTGEHWLALAASGMSGPEPSIRHRHVASGAAA
jgi:hypothetical protein